MNNTAFAICDDPAENAFYLHPDLRLIGTAYDLGRDLWTFIKLDDSKHIRRQHRVLFSCGVDHCERNDCAGTRERMLDNLSCPAAVRAECPGREEVPPAPLAFCTYHVVPLGDMSPEPCYRHLIPSRGCGQRLLHRSRPRCASCRFLHPRSGASQPPHGAAGRSRRPV